MHFCPLLLLLAAEVAFANTNKELVKAMVEKARVKRALKADIKEFKAVKSGDAVAEPEPEPEVVQAMEGCKLVWEEKENCVTESDVDICKVVETEHCEEMSRVVCKPTTSEELNRAKRETPMEIEKPGEILLPQDLRSIYEHTNHVDDAPFYPPPKNSNFLPKTDDRHENLVPEGTLSPPSPLYYRGVQEKCSPVTEIVCTTEPMEVCQKGNKEVCTLEKVPKEVCPKGRVHRFLGKIGHQIRGLLDAWSK